MQKNIISPTVDADNFSKQYKKFLSSLSVEFRFSLNSLLSWIHLWRQSRFDYSATVQAFEIVEQHTELQTLLLEQLLNWRFAPNEFDPDASSVSPNVEFLYQKLRKFQYSVANEFKSYLNRTHNLTQQWREGQLDDHASIQALKEIEQNAKRQSQLLEKLLNWDFDLSEVEQEYSYSYSKS